MKDGSEFARMRFGQQFRLELLRGPVPVSRNQLTCLVVERFAMGDLFGCGTRFAEVANAGFLGIMASPRTGTF